MSIREGWVGKPPFDSETNMLSSGSLYMCFGLDFMRLRLTSNRHIMTAITANITNPPTTTAPAITPADEFFSSGGGCGEEEDLDPGSGTEVGVEAGLERDEVIAGLDGRALLDERAGLDDRALVDGLPLEGRARLEEVTLGHLLSSDIFSATIKSILIVSQWLETTHL